MEGSYCISAAHVKLHERQATKRLNLLPPFLCHYNKVFAQPEKSMLRCLVFIDNVH